jgi:hypothetical protein
MRVFLFLLALLPLPAGETLFRAPISGGQTLYRPYDLWVQIAPRWYDAEPASMDLVNHTITVPSRTYTNGETIYTLSSGTLPFALSPFYPSYMPCSTTGNTFRVQATSVGSCNTTAYKTFPDAGTGQLYVGKSLNGASTVHDSAGRPLSLNSGKYVVSGSTSALVRIQVRAEPDTPLGTGYFRGTMEVNGEDAVFLEWPITVKDTPRTELRRPISFPTVPLKAKWESEMMARANQWCDKSTGVLKGIPDGQVSFGVEQQIWYYDGAWVYRQVAAYSGDPDWIRCADNITTQYRDRYVLQNNGAIPNWRIFTDGLKNACSNCDGRNRHALLQLAIKNLAPNGGSVWTSGMRESSYIVESTINAANAFGYTELSQIPNTAPWSTVKSGLTVSASRLLGMMDAVRGDYFVSQQTFMIGLALRALIQYWEYTGDPRVPVEVKGVLDYIWDQLWDRTRNQLIFNVSPRGPKCEVTCNPIAQTELINLTVPAYAWYWSITGDDTYRERGDEIFANSLNTSINYSGKIFTQNYRWSFDYVLLREGTPRYRP